MINNKATHDDLRIRKVKKYGDTEIFISGYTSYIWNLILHNHKLALRLILADYLRFQMAMGAWIENAFFRFGHGSSTTGLILSFCSFFWLLVFNSNNVWIIFKPVMTFIAPTVPLWSEADTLYRLVFVEIHSKSILIFSFVFLVVSLVHVGMIWGRKGEGHSYRTSIFDVGGARSATKRGQSWILVGLTLLLKGRRVNEYMVCGIIEPAIASAVGYLFWKAGDTWMATLLWYGAFSVAFQQLLDHAHYMQQKALLNI